MFNYSKYTRWYYSIINRAKCQDRKKKQGIYFEQHHIIPRSIGGNNKKENLVLLTAKEHFICHLLLTKMCVEKQHQIKMLYAFSMLNASSKGQFRITSRKYNVSAKSKAIKSIIAIHGDIPWRDKINKNPEKIRKTADKNRGRKNSPESIEKFKKINSGSGNPTYGKVWITNGVENKLVDKPSLQLFGEWRLGRTMKKDKSGKFISGYQQSFQHQ